MLVSEIFTSIQGEGYLAGVPSVFLRLHGCPHKCFFCDTKYTWLPDHRKKPVIMNHGEIMSRLMSEFERYPNIRQLVITGGEPLYGANGSGLADLINLLLTERSISVSIETSGTECPPDFFKRLEYLVWITISPKLAPDEEHFRYPHWEVLTHASEIKYLMGYAKKHFMGMIESYRETCNPIRNSNVSEYIQPIAYVDSERTRQARKNAIEAAKELGMGLSIQMHKLLDIP